MTFVEIEKEIRAGLLNYFTKRDYSILNKQFKRKKDIIDFVYYRDADYIVGCINLKPAGIYIIDETDIDKAIKDIKSKLNAN